MTEETTDANAALSAYRDWLNQLNFRFAKTYAHKGPHEYVVRDWSSVETPMFNAFKQFIEENGYHEVYNGYEYTCLDVGNHKYWTIGKILNRRSYQGYDVVQELLDMGEDPGEYLPVGKYEAGNYYGAAERPDNDA